MPTEDAGQTQRPDSGRPGDPDAGSMPVAPCEAYCDAVMVNCVDANAQYPDMGTCLSVCESAGWDVGQSGAQDGDTIACRTYYAGVAADDAATHCPAAGPSGGNVCGTWCEVYCGVNLTICTGENAQHGSEAECLSACADFADDGSANDDMGNTVQCRIYHSGHLALRDPATECTYTGVDPVNYCIDVAF